MSALEIRHGSLWLELGPYAVSACHFRCRGDSRESERHAGYLPADEGAWLLHGHVHGKWQVRGGRQIDVGVDAWDYQPVSEDELVATIEAGGNRGQPIVRAVTRAQATEQV